MVAHMPTDSDGSDLLRPGEAAKLLHVTTRALANWADAGHVPTFRLPGGERRYRRADILALATPATPA